MKKSLFGIVALALVLIGSGCIPYEAPAQNLEMSGNSTNEEVESVYISLDDYTYEQSNSRIRFTGEVSPNTNRIIVTFSSGTFKDVYTLENFHPGDLRFQYQADEEWDNLKQGTNSYEFVAYGENGDTATTNAKINYTLKNTYETPTSYTPTNSYTIPAKPSISKPILDAPVTSCCKYCSTGKACGDSCISRSYTCHKGPGCACNSY